MISTAKIQKGEYLEYYTTTLGNITWKDPVIFRCHYFLLKFARYVITVFSA